MKPENRLFLLLLLLFNVSTIFTSTQEDVEVTTKKTGWHRKGRTTTTTTTFRPHRKLQGRMMAMPCKTPNDDEGYCIPIKLCSKLMNALENPNSSDFIRASRCNSQNEADSGNPTVCCGEDDVYNIEPGRSVIMASTPTIKSVMPKRCGQPKVIDGGRIFGGKDALLGQYPWMARLIHKDSHNLKMFGCTGFLIHPKFVATAAHCLESDNIEVMGPVFEVQLGEHDVTKKIDCDSNANNCADPPQTVKVKEIIVHPGYNKSSVSHYDDIGLLYIRKVNETTWIHPICLQENQNHKTINYYLSGWGKTETEEASDIKKKVTIKSTSLRDCADNYAMIGLHISENQTCAGGEAGKDSCSGDSGGPLMSKDDGIYYADGIVSFGLGCGRKGWPGVYTKVASYVGWINQEMAERLSSKPKNKV